MDPGFLAASLISGALIGLVLGLIGGGGSILAVPLLIYVVGVESTQIAIGTAALAVALNAGSGLAAHARKKNVRWPCALSFAGAGIIGAALGAEAGKATDSDSLLGLFGALMIAVGIRMIAAKRGPGDPLVRMTRSNASSMLRRILPAGLGVGLLAGFFGIGGGFLIVPALLFATGLPISLAIGSSLAVVLALGATTAASYAFSGLIDWELTGLLIVGGIVGTLLGRGLLDRLSGKQRLLEVGFAAIVIAIGIFVTIDAVWQLV